MKILKQYENRQMSLQIARTEIQTEKVLSSRPWTSADESMFKINELVDIDLRSNTTKPTNTVDRNTPINKTVHINLNDTHKPNFQESEKLFASKQFNRNEFHNENLNENKRTVADNDIPGLSFNISVKRS